MPNIFFSESFNDAYPILPIKILLTELRPPFNTTEYNSTALSGHINLESINIKSNIRGVNRYSQLLWSLELVSDYFTGANNTLILDKDILYNLEIQIGIYKFSIAISNNKITAITQSTLNEQGLYEPIEIEEDSLRWFISSFIDDLNYSISNSPLDSHLETVLIAQLNKPKETMRGIFLNSDTDNQLQAWVWSKARLNLMDKHIDQEVLIKALSDYIIVNLRKEVLNKMFSAEVKFEDINFDLIVKDFSVVKSAIRIFVKILVEGAINPNDTRDLYCLGLDLAYFFVSLSDTEFEPLYVFGPPNISFKALLGNSEDLYREMYNLIVDVWNYIANNLKPGDSDYSESDYVTI